MSKNSRSGGKYSGNHTTLIDVAAIACDITHRCPEVTRISPGFIKSGLPSVGGRSHVKITHKTGYIFLSIRGNISHQEIHVYVSKVQPALEWIARGLRDEGIAICFEKKPRRERLESCSLI